MNSSAVSAASAAGLSPMRTSADFAGPEGTSVLECEFVIRVLAVSSSLCPWRLVVLAVSSVILAVSIVFGFLGVRTARARADRFARGQLTGAFSLFPTCSADENTGHFQGFFVNLVAAEHLKLFIQQHGTTSLLHVHAAPGRLRA